MRLGNIAALTLVPLTLAACGGEPGERERGPVPDARLWSQGPTVTEAGVVYAAITSDAAVVRGKDGDGSRPTRPPSGRVSGPPERREATRTLRVISVGRKTTEMVIRRTCPDGRPDVDRRDTPDAVAMRIADLEVPRLCVPRTGGMGIGKAVRQAEINASGAARGGMPPEALEAVRRYGGGKQTRP